MGWILFIVLLVCVGAYLAYACFRIDSGVFIRPLCKGETSKRLVCLTFDDGPHPEYTPQLLDVLKKYEAPASFFCIGEKVRENPSVMKRIIAEGHHIGNHSNTHSWKFPFLSEKKMYNELEGCEEDLLTYSAILTVRPPFGVTNPTFGRVVDEMGYMAIGWSIRSFDTLGESEDKIFNRIVRQIEPGAVILLHDRMPGCASLVARLLEHLKTIDYKVIALDKMFFIPNPYVEDNEYLYYL